MSSLVSPDEVQARGIGLELSDEALQDVIDEVESWLARRIGPLTGERTETLYPRREDEWLYLRRPADSITLDNAGTTVTAGESIGNYRLLYSGSVVQLIGIDWYLNATGIGLGPVEVTYTPNDEAEVRGAIFDLIRLRQAEGPYVSERIGEYSYQKAQSAGAMDTARNAVLQRLTPKRPFRSERIVSSVRP